MMLLVYYRMYITYELAGHLFGLDQSNVYRDIRYMEPAVRGSIPIPPEDDVRRIQKDRDHTGS